MDFTFLHAADLHLGSPFIGLSRKDEELSKRLTAASRDAFHDLVTKAIDAHVAFAVIAGDLFDGDWRDVSIGLFFNREVSRLARAGIPVFIARGNHDAESKMTKALPLPEGVQYFSSRKAETHLLDSLKVAIHGRSFAERAATENYAAHYPDPKRGWFNLGVLHTSCEGHSAHAAYAPCSVAELAASGYDYWALGHIHEFAILHERPHIVYSGNLQGRSARECGPKGAVFVEVKSHRVENVRHQPFDKARWRRITLEIAPSDEKEGILERLKSQAAEALRDDKDVICAVRVELMGQTPLHGRIVAEQTAWREDVQSALHHLDLDIWLETLKIKTQPPATAAPAADLGFDPNDILRDIEKDEDLLRNARAHLDLVQSKIPRNAEDAASFDFDAILKNARDAALARILSEG